MTQKELVKQAKKNIRERNREAFNFLELWQSISLILIQTILVGGGGASGFSLVFHIKMVQGTWEYPYGQTEIIWTGIGALPCVIMIGLIALFLVGLAIYCAVSTIIEHNADRKRELEAEIVRLNKEKNNE